MSHVERALDREADSIRAARAKALVARYEPLVGSIARASVVDPILARAITSEALLAVLTMPAHRRSNAAVIEATRRIATDTSARFAAASRAPPRSPP